MVCDKCKTKLTKLIGVDPYRNKPHNKPVGVTKNKATGLQNKWLGSEKKAGIVGVKCKICKQSLHQVGSHYCQNCAFQKGICAMCGKKITDVSMSRQTVV
ncbi:unnamed protein product, partial [Mesorhabditis belari]|uniref:Cysteine-rich PDZ-binding protein n=1 Tax=Mesorhabditis belari TaxID=2138241 RepID=A0AAF3F5P3_9BILA